ncbi:serine/threonine-protein phosphatase 2A activator-like [Tropilaelaps mercedesae]|uniref:Serine/threonine-protein phosphatase 2A activator n=1 Tax=Tropilaelaps mercedesae TaxID=418985 RepID=A0A1V9XBA5_9ACAR|nr:serine/threonine-protein phosphatase 2A activator-like [Tropilaelaps mercedesae]
MVIPVRQIKAPSDMPKWTNSKAYDDYVLFVLAMNKAVKGLNAKSQIRVSDNCYKLISLLDTLDQYIAETPPVQQPARFGNAAFRTWFAKLNSNKDILLQDILPAPLHGRVPELAAYLIDAFGNKTRIDYGTGHEMNFALVLMCLFKLEYFTEPDAPAIVIKVFDRYMKLVRRLQTAYRMEPAGSHGVWSLDDYQFLPFIWGSSQLIIEPPGKPVEEISVPCQFLNEDVPEKYEDDYLFMACIAYINRAKKGPFFEHSNQLYNASGTPSWQRLNDGTYNCT